MQFNVLQCNRKSNISVVDKTANKKEKEIRNSTKLCVLLGRLLLIAGSFWSIVRRFDLCARFKCLAALFGVVVVTFAGFKEVSL